LSRRSWPDARSQPYAHDFYKKYQDIIADYNREKDRVTVEETFAKLLELARSLDIEERRAAEEVSRTASWRCSTYWVGRTSARQTANA